MPCAALLIGWKASERRLPVRRRQQLLRCPSGSRLTTRAGTEQHSVPALIRSHPDLPDGQFQCLERRRRPPHLRLRCWRTCRHPARRPASAARRALKPSQRVLQGPPRSEGVQPISRAMQGGGAQRGRPAIVALGGCTPDRRTTDQKVGSPNSKSCSFVSGRSLRAFRQAVSEANRGPAGGVAAPTSESPEPPHGPSPPHTTALPSAIAG